MKEKKCCIGNVEASVRGASDIASVENGVRAVFSGKNTEEIGSLFFEHTAEITTPTELVFKKNCKKMFFFRAENFENADISFDITAEENAEVFFVFLVNNQENSKTTCNIRISAEKNSHVNIAGMHLNKGIFEGKIESKLQGKNAECDIFFTEIGGGKSTATIELINASQHSETKGDIRTRCILSDSAKSSIRGIPTVELNAQNCVSHLDQKTILLSPDARSISVPMLNISNNRVEASHKSSFVHLTAEDAFYIQSRGVSKKNIADLLLDGMLNETLGNIPEEAIQNCIGELAHSFLHDIS